MKITYEVDYALKAVLDIALHCDEPAKIEEIGKRQDIPRKFLEQILLQLKKGGFVRSRRGRCGGYSLSRPPRKIKMGEVIEFIEGPIEPISCVARNNRTKCNFSSRCAFYDIFDNLGRTIRKEVDGYNFDDIKDLQIKKQIANKNYWDYSI